MSIAQAQSVSDIYHSFTKRYHTYLGTTLPYHVFVPRNYDSSSRYPLVLCLHGAGERGDDSTAVCLNSMATVWAMDSNQTRWPCLIVVPQCPKGRQWVNAYWVSGSYRVDNVPISNELLTVNNILDSLIKEFSVDTNRLYITGLSMGGCGTFDMIVRYPQKFAAAIPMSGGGDTTKADVIKQMPIWDFHGGKDDTVPVARSRDMIAALEKIGRTAIYTEGYSGDSTGLSDSAVADIIHHGANLLYTEYKNLTHNIWTKAYTYPLLLPWVFSQNKSLAVNDVKGMNGVQLPAEYSLQQNYPNPFNPNTTVQFSIPRTSDISLRIYDAIGREVAILITGKMNAGIYKTNWNASDMPSGVYFYRLSVVPADSWAGQSGSFVQSKKLIVIK